MPGDWEIEKVFTNWSNKISRIVFMSGTDEQRAKATLKNSLVLPTVPKGPANGIESGTLS